MGESALPLTTMINSQQFIILAMLSAQREDRNNISKHEGWHRFVVRLTKWLAYQMAFSSAPAFRCGEHDFLITLPQPQTSINPLHCTAMQSKCTKNALLTVHFWCILNQCIVVNWLGIGAEVVYWNRFGHSVRS